MKFLTELGFEMTYLDVDRNGLVSPQQAADAVREDTILVSVMHTNNEIGAREPIEAIGEAVKAKNPETLFHVDAVQGFGKAVILPKKLHVDLLSVSGHKIHAAKGVGFLYIGDGVRIRNILFGGGQQNGLRSGTENVAGIAGMAMAAKMIYDHLDEETDRLYRMKEFFLREISTLDGIHVNGTDGIAVRDTAPHVISLSVEGVRAEVLLHALEEKGIYVSSGSACSSNRPHISETLQAIGVPKEALDSTIRLSTSVMNTMEDMEYTLEVLKELIPFLRRYTRD